MQRNSIKKITCIINNHCFQYKCLYNTISTDNLIFKRKRKQLPCIIHYFQCLIYSSCLKRDPEKKNMKNKLGLLIWIHQEQYIHRKKSSYLLQSKSLMMGKPKSTLHSWRSSMALSLSRLGKFLVAVTKQSHATRISGFVGAEAFKPLRALQQTVAGLLTLSVIKGRHGANGSFVFTQSTPFTGSMVATVRINTTAKDRDILFIFPHSFISIFHLSLFFR